MNKVKSFVLISVIVAFVAGILIGLFIREFGKKPHLRSRLSRELDLTSEQRDQLRDIWSEAIRTARRLQREQRQRLQEERDGAIEQLLTEDQKAGFNKIKNEYAQKIDDLAQARDSLLYEAVEKTKRILSETQRKKYEELVKEQEEGGWKHYRP